MRERSEVYMIVMAGDLVAEDSDGCTVESREETGDYIAMDQSVRIGRILAFITFTSILTVTIAMNPVVSVCR